MFPRHVPTSGTQPLVRHDFLGLICSWVAVREEVGYESGDRFREGLKMWMDGAGAVEAHTRREKCVEITMHRGGEPLTNSVSQERFPFSDLLPFPKVTSDVFKLVPIRRDATRPPRRRLESCGVVRSFFLRALSPSLPPSLPPSTVSRHSFPPRSFKCSRKFNDDFEKAATTATVPDFADKASTRTHTPYRSIADIHAYSRTWLLQTFIQNEMQVICSSVGPSKMLH